MKKKTGFVGLQKFFKKKILKKPQNIFLVIFYEGFLECFLPHPLDDEKMIFQSKLFLRLRTPQGPAPPNMAPPDVENDAHNDLETAPR